MDFLNDYWSYHSCYEIPRNYAYWSGIGLLGSTLHRRVLYIHGDIEMHPTMYIGLIGPQGNSKSTCCTFAREFFREACPDLQVGPSRASPEALVKTMSDEKFARLYKDRDGNAFEVRPYAFFINEFKNFVGRSPFDMLTFLTDIYDVKAYDASTIIRGGEFIVNPALSILCCETPEWIIKNIKGDVISGGFGRRIIYVFETEDIADKPLPLITTEAREAIKRVKQRLVEVKQVYGQYVWDIPAARVYDTWYRQNATVRRKENNLMMKGYLRTKHVQMFKLMMLLDASSDRPMLNFTSSLMEHALFYLDLVQPNMAKLSQSAGRNELLGAQQKILEILEREHMWVEEARIKRLMQADLTPQETFHTLRHLEESEQIVRIQVMFPGREKSTFGITTPKLREEFKKNGSTEQKRRSQLNASPSGLRPNSSELGESLPERHVGGENPPTTGSNDGPTAP